MKVFRNEVAYHLHQVSRALDSLSIMAKVASLQIEAFNSLMRPIWIRQRELKHLRVKQYTLGLTHLEKQRMYGKVTTKPTTRKPEIGTTD